MEFNDSVKFLVSSWKFNSVLLRALMLTELEPRFMGGGGKLDGGSALDFTVLEAGEDIEGSLFFPS
jgi:hypothetical protein